MITLINSGITSSYRRVLHWTPFHATVAKGNYDKVKKFLDAGVNPNIRLHGNARGTAMTIAAARKHLSVVKLLLERGADPGSNLYDWGETPLHAAVRVDNMDLFHILIRYGADPTLKDKRGKSLLHSSRSALMVKTLIGLGLIPNAQDQSGRTPPPQHISLLF